MLTRQPEQLVRQDQPCAGSRVVIAGKVKKRSFAIQTFLKGCIDLVGAGVMIIFFTPLFVLLSFLVLIDDGCPIIYRRRVVGREGEFDAFKFRSMRRDADAILTGDPALRAKFEQNFKLRNDPRLTFAGAF